MTTRALVAVLTLLPATALPAQHQTVDVDAQLVGLYRWSSRTPDGGGLGEARLVQPVVMARARLGRGALVRATANLEGLTIPSGELLPGAWGEGFVDRRHPHTYVHELLVEAVARPRCAVECRLGAFAGKGFVPFGSDDPMSRPFLAYPVNHHLAQVLERAVVGGQVAIGPVFIEGAVFNGDEPERPGQWPSVRRFGDSWATRLTMIPAQGLELSGSFASVHSPEHRPGAGATQTKYHTGLRLDRPLGTDRILVLAEWARTSELDGFFRFDSRLAEVQWRRGRLGVQYRLERTDRPEEERLDAFRSARPHLENSILGVTRWSTHLLGVVAPVRQSDDAVGVDAIVEIGTATVDRLGGGLFDPATTYGGRRLWTLSIGLRVSTGFRDHRMGRYGVVAGDH